MLRFGLGRSPERLVRCYVCSRDPLPAKHLWVFRPREAPPYHVHGSGKPGAPNRLLTPSLLADHVWIREDGSVQA
jgi:hypothetical protein